jgi:DNA-binding NarL/FixJ family response regulator
MESVQRMASSLPPDEAERRLRIANGVLRKALESAPRLNELNANDRAILACLAAGLTHHQIARLFGLSTSTVKNHVALMRKRIDVPGTNRGEGALAQLAALYAASLTRQNASATTVADDSDGQP